MDVKLRSDADNYLRFAIEEIDRQLGEGYAKAHPDLIGAFMQAAVADIATGIIDKALREMAAAIEALAPEK